MQIRLNGKERDVRDDITVADILAELNIHPEPVPRKIWAAVLGRGETRWRQVGADAEN